MEMILKILSGPHIGAEVLLKEGEYVIGSGEESDLVFCDVSVASRHAKLTLRDGGISVLPLEGPVCLDGQEISPGESPIRFNQIVTLGTIHFGLIPSHGSWSEVELPTFLAAHLGNTGEARRDALDSPVESSGSSEHAQTPQNPHLSLLRSRKGFWAVLVPSLCGLVLVCFLLFSQFAGRRDGSPTSMDRLHSVKLLLNRLQMDSVGIETSRSGAARIKGYVENNEQKLLLLRELHLNSLNYPVELWTNEQILSLAADVIKTTGLDLAITTDGLGVLKLKGCIERRQDLTGLAARLKEDIPAIVRLESEVCVIEEASPQMTELLEAHHLRGKLRVLPRGRALEVDGELTEREMERWRTAASQFTAGYGHCVSMKENVALRPEDRQPQQATGETREPGLSQAPSLELSSPLVAVALGNVKFVMNERGRKFAVGDELEPGYVIQSIERYRLVVKKANEEITLPMVSLSIYMEY